MVGEGGVVRRGGDGGGWDGGEEGMVGEDGMVEWWGRGWWGGGDGGWGGEVEGTEIGRLHSPL